MHNISQTQEEMIQKFGIKWLVIYIAIGHLSCLIDFLKEMDAEYNFVEKYLGFKEWLNKC